MSVKGINTKLNVLSELPKAPTTLGTRGKYHFKRLGTILISNKILKSLHLPALEIMAENWEQWEWSIKAMRKKNRNNPGTGYIQTFTTGAKNLSVELTVKRDAEKAIMQCIKQFGLDPKSEKDLNADTGQLGIEFPGFGKKKTN